MICNICSKDKPYTEFYKNKKNKSGFDYRCKECRKIQASQWNKSNKNRRAEIRIKSSKKHRVKNNAKSVERYWNNIEYYREQRRKYNKRYYETHKDLERQRHAKYLADNKEKVALRKRKWHLRKMKVDVCYALSIRLRSRLNKAVKHMYKSGSAVNDLGCSVGELKKYLECKFYDHPRNGKKNVLG